MIPELELYKLVNNGIYSSWWISENEFMVAVDFRHIEKFMTELYKICGKYLNYFFGDDNRISIYVSDGYMTINMFDFVDNDAIDLKYVFGYNKKPEQ